MTVIEQLNLITMQKRLKAFLPWLLLLILGGVLLLLVAVSFWRSDGTEAQVQVPMFYDAHYFFPRPWTQEQAAPGIPDETMIALYAANEISQAFTAGADQLAMISFWLAGPPGSRARATLKSNGETVSQEEIRLSSGIGGGEYHISFSPISDSSGRQFVLSLAAPEATADAPVTVKSVGGDRLGGPFSLNEFTRPGNLVLATYLKSTPGSWWFPLFANNCCRRHFNCVSSSIGPRRSKATCFLGCCCLRPALAHCCWFWLVLFQRCSLGSVARALAWFAVIMVGRSSDMASRQRARQDPRIFA